MPTEIISRTDARAKGLKRFFTGDPCLNGHVDERDVRFGKCTECARVRGRRYDAAHPDTRGSARALKWRAENRQKFDDYCTSEGGRNVRRRAVRKWSKNNRAAINAYRRAATESDIGFRLRINLANRINQAVRYVWGHKSARTLDLLGCTILELRTHLEGQFQPGMSWGNYGYGDDKWHIDHVRPCALFDLTDPAQQRACFNYKNLQPLWQPDNFRKNKRVGDACVATI